MSGRARLLAVTVLLLVACQPTRNLGWTPLATHNGQPVKRASCEIRFKINKDRYPDGGVKALGINVPGEITRAAAEMHALTGVRWVYDGYTSATVESTAGAAWAGSQGVLIELRSTNWSQPKPADGPTYTGGAIWYDMDLWAYLRQHQPASYRQAVLGTIRHEMGHQHGLGDLYASSFSPAAISANRMGTSRNPWGAGDRQGFTALRPEGCS